MANYYDNQLKFYDELIANLKEIQDKMQDVIKLIQLDTEIELKALEQPKKEAAADAR